MIILEPAYDTWLCGGLLFNLRMTFSGVFVRGACTEDRERVPRGITRLASCGSGVVIGSVWSSGDH